MFTMTPRAHAVVRRVTAHARIGCSSGLRIAARTTDDDALDVGTAPGPRAGDEVVERDGARVFLDHEALPRVRGRVLDAVTEGDGRIHFVVRRRR
jgi:Fe-S cluster assembly iron-binding protein IscA